MIHVRESVNIWLSVSLVAAVLATITGVSTMLLAGVLVARVVSVATGVMPLVSVGYGLGSGDYVSVSIVGAMYAVVVAARSGGSTASVTYGSWCDGVHV